MKPEDKSVNLESATGQAGAPNATPATRKGWAVKFTVPQPQQGMPSERLKARAELVRKALGCSTY